MASLRIENITPVLGVADLERTRAFYVDLLGFAIDWGFDGVHQVCGLSRDGKGLMVSTFEKAGVTSWVGVEDIVPFHARLIEAGVTILQPPTNQLWTYEFRALDPDGNVLWFGSGPLDSSE